MLWRLLRVRSGGVIDDVAGPQRVRPRRVPRWDPRRAGQLYPDAVQYLTRKRDAGRVDAIRIAQSGLMTLRPAQLQVSQ